MVDANERGCGPASNGRGQICLVAYFCPVYVAQSKLCEITVARISHPDQRQVVAMASIPAALVRAFVTRCQQEAVQNAHRTLPSSPWTVIG